jgi:phage gpG-like protein
MISFSWKFPPLLKKFSAKEEEIYRYMAAQLQTNRGLLFDAEGARNGNKAWGKPKFRNGQAGSSRGTLRKSLGTGGKSGPHGKVRISRGRVAIGSSLIYAGMFNFGPGGLPGGVLRAKDGGVLRIPIPSGKRATAEAKAVKKTKSTNEFTGREENVIFRKWVRIQPRRFDILTDADQAELSRALKAKLVQVLK